MAGRHERVVQICDHPYGTEVAIFALYAARKEARGKAILDGPVDDDDFDWESYLDYAVEHDAACILLADRVASRMSGVGGGFLSEEKRASLLTICEEAINERA